MINGKEFIQLVKEHYSFLMTEFSYIVIEEKIRGNAFYEVRFQNSDNVISISYESIVDYLSILIYLLVNNALPDYDDPIHTLHLNKLNLLLLPKISKRDIEQNKNYFGNKLSSSKLEYRLLKSAAELRLYLKYGDLLPH